MRSLRLVRSALLGFATACSGLQPALAISPSHPKLPFYDWGACPFECCTYRDWATTGHVEFRTKPSRGAAIAFRLVKGEPVRGLTGVVITRTYGVTRILRPMKIGYVGKEELPRLAIKPGALVYTLHYEGEGYDKFWFNGSVYSDQISMPDDARRTVPNSENVQVISRPKYEWWAKVRTTDGRVGWTDQTDRFSNIDACG